MNRLVQGLDSCFVSATPFIIFIFIKNNNIKRYTMVDSVIVLNGASSSNIQVKDIMSLYYLLLMQMLQLNKLLI
jgi:hypothetical protein